MSHKKADTITALRADADASIATWRELESVAKAKREAQVKCPTTWRYNHKFHGHDDLRSAQLDVEALQAEEVAERARAAASCAVDEADLAEGNETALARSPKHLHDDLTALSAEEAALNEKLYDVRRRRDERVKVAFSGDTALASRRAERGEPQFTPLPRCVPTPVGQPTFMDRLSERVAVREPTRSFQTRIENARASVIRIAAELEERRLAKEEEERTKADEKKQREQAIADEQRRQHARDQARIDEINAEEKRRAKLAADYLHNTSGGAQ